MQAIRYAVRSLVFAVGIGMPSIDPISVEVRPTMVASRTARRCSTGNRSSARRSPRRSSDSTAAMARSYVLGSISSAAVHGSTSRAPSCSGKSARNSPGCGVSTASLPASAARSAAPES